MSIRLNLLMPVQASILARPFARVPKVASRKPIPQGLAVRPIAEAVSEGD
jgi:hypothetical protein